MQIKKIKQQKNQQIKLLMQKQDRRQNYTKKSIHQKKEKQSRKESSLMTENLIQRMKNFQLKEILSFMYEQYDKLITREKNVENELNVIILKRIEQLKSLWLSFHRQRLIAFLEKTKLPFKNDSKLSLLEIVQPLWKKNQYYWSNRIVNRIGRVESTGPFNITQIQILYPVKTDGFFFLQGFNETIDFRIDFKRMMKDVTYICKNFHELVEDVERQLKLKWQQK